MFWNCFTKPLSDGFFLFFLWDKDEAREFEEQIKTNEVYNNNFIEGQK